MDGGRLRVFFGAWYGVSFLEFFAIDRGCRGLVFCLGWKLGIFFIW